MSVEYYCSILFGFLVFFQGASASLTPHLEPGTYTSGEINDYADKVLELVRPAMVRNGFDPFKIDDISQDFWFKVLFVNYTGHIDLKNGWLQDLSTIRRFGDVKIKYEKKILTIYMELLVDSLMAHFDHTMKIFDIGPSGYLSTKIKKQIVNFGLLVDFERITFHLQHFALDRNEEVKVKITGLGLADPLVGIIVDAITAIFKNSVTSAIGNQIRYAIQSLIETLPPLLPPPPPQSITQEELCAVLKDLTDGINSLQFPTIINDLN